MAGSACCQLLSTLSLPEGVGRTRQARLSADSSLVKAWLAEHAHGASDRHALLAFAAWQALLHGCVKDTSSRWGSCTSQRDLAFSWRLVMAPGFVQDYVVAHEVAHLRHMNHSAAFWGLVDTLTEHREPAIGWLRREGAQLMRIG